MKEQMKIDLEIIRKNKVEEYAIEYIKLDRQECELQKQGRLSNELLEMFENKKRELVNKSYTYYDEIEKEMTKLDSIMNESTHPFTVIMGGKKISDKTLVIDNLIKKCDYLLLGGGMCFTFLKSMNLNTGLSIVDNDNIEYCKNILNNNKDKLILPLDIVTKDNKIKNINEISDEDIGYDIGPKTIKEFTHILKNSKRVIVNGPMGVFEEEPFSHGTKEILQVLKENNIKTLVGGGDSASAVNQLGFASEFYHISTGGGATLEYLSGKKLPGIEAISDK